MNAKYQNYLRCYKEHIRDAFEGFFRTWDRDALLRAIDLYNMDKYEEAIKILDRLRKKCKTVNEHCVVLTFTALCYDDLLVLELVMEYRQLCHVVVGFQLGIHLDDRINPV